MPRPGRRRGGYSQAARVLRILDRLSAHRYGVTLEQLADEFEVSVRQVRRDLEAIEEAGHPIQTLTVDGKTGAKLEAARAAGVRLSVRERYALLAVRRAFDVLEDTPFHEDVRSICTKLASSLPPAEQQELESFGERFVYLPDGGTKQYRGMDDVIDALFTGVLRRCRVNFRYRAQGREERQGVLEPYAVVLYRQGLYVIGHSVSGQAGPGRERTYAVERFTHAEYERGTSFTVPESFRVEEYFQGAFGVFRGEAAPTKVVVDFAPAGRTLVEARIWHPSQRLRRIADGGVRLEMVLSDLTQVAQWVIGWGPLARVREPKALVERVTREHKEALAAYRR